MKQVLVWVLILLARSNCALADNLPITVFPMGNYPQNINYWLLESDNHTLLINKKLQQIKFAQLKSHYFGVGKDDQSPWSENFVAKILAGEARKNIYTSECAYIDNFDNSKISESRQLGYGVNYLPYTKNWVNSIKVNMNLEQFQGLKYGLQNRAIVTSDTEAYSIPTSDPWYLSYTIAGEGFPFNNNLLSGVKLGTPVYVIGGSYDKRWLLVLTPQFIGWIDARVVGYVKQSFIDKWMSGVGKSLGAVIALHTTATNQYGIIANILSGGVMLPLVGKQDMFYQLLLPVRNPQNGIAQVLTVNVSSTDVVEMPYLATYGHFKQIINMLLGYSYGWGGYLGYNDCSADLQVIYTAFGFFMPRNSSQQVRVGLVVDLSGYLPEKRYQYIVNNASPMVTFIYINGHIMLYVGNVRYKSQIVPVVYQNIWGMRKNNQNIRAVIGRSVLFPLLLGYGESADYVSLFSKPVFKISYLNKDAGNYDMLNLLY